MDADRWQFPQEIDDATLAFPANVVGTLMPDEEQIPADFRNDTGDAQPWVQLQKDWFFHGLKNPKFACADGVDGATAVRHLQAIQGSFEPKHEHKQAAVAYLASRWFTGVEYERAKEKP